MPKTPVLERIGIMWYHILVSIAGHGMCVICMHHPKHFHCVMVGDAMHWCLSIRGTLLLTAVVLQMSRGPWTTCSRASCPQSCPQCPPLGLGRGRTTSSERRSCLPGRCATFPLCNCSALTEHPAPMCTHVCSMARTPVMPKVAGACPGAISGEAKKCTSTLSATCGRRQV